ncbi:uncharacterized protein AB675_7729 [Cyphellophora attinorum]|uniref:Uncharacterized protein n=1 Tax=Cyphellophora attinorum TaxID=1664694 RepID=A0A0N1P1F7_9EURO|nr:uncharacterized protein AB675_7729 [Phialophora attinorum]KPI40607.1 hypothetical protein AB675_7729 [Phialophora attinorum]
MSSPLPYSMIFIATTRNKSYINMNATRKSSLIEINVLARSARVKMVQECRRPDMDLRHVVGHANFLDHLKNVTLQAHLEIIQEKPTPKKQPEPEIVYESVECEEDDDMAMAFESTPYSSSQSVITVEEPDSDDSNSDNSDSDEEFSPLTRSKPIAIPQSKVSVTAVEVC